MCVFFVLGRLCNVSLVLASVVMIFYICLYNWFRLFVCVLRVCSFGVPFPEVTSEHLMCILNNFSLVLWEVIIIFFLFSLCSYFWIDTLFSSWKLKWSPSTHALNSSNCPSSNEFEGTTKRFFKGIAITDFSIFRFYIFGLRECHVFLLKG